jgi:hypothetical protein
MTEPEPVIHEAAAAPASEPITNGSNGPIPTGDEARHEHQRPESPQTPELSLGPEDLPLATVAPPPAEPVIVSRPINEPVFQMAAVAPSPVAPPEPAPSGKPAEVEALEDRLRRLEALLGNMADTRQLEERLAERLSKRVEAPVATAAVAPLATRAPVVDQPAKPNAVVEAGRRWLPFAFRGRATTSSGASTDSRLEMARASWLFFDIVREFQSILHMYGDPRYRLTWSGRILPVVFLALIATSGFWTYPLTGWMPTLLGNLVLKTIDLVPAFCLFKVLTREARRYRDMVPPHSPHSS